MSWRFILQVIGVLIFVLGATMLVPLGWGLWFGDGSVTPLWEAMACCVLVGGVMRLFFRTSEPGALTQREGMAIVALGWTLIGVFGGLPFWFADIFPTFADCFFESVSGFTTTGASVMTNIEGVPRGLLFWRSQIQWIGGMGIIVFSIAILPFLGVGGMQMYKAEVPSPFPDKLKPRIQDTASVLWKVYGGITVIQIALLMFGGMDLYDATCHAFTTMPTGGFSTKNLSVAHFDSAYIDYVITLFMLLSGINFSLHYQFLRGETLAFWKDAECRFFLFVTLGMIAFVTFDLHGPVYETVSEAFRYGSFQVVSILTTTGYATADYEIWTPASQVLLFVCMFIGACAGSTGGGMKFIRVMACGKYCYNELFSLVHPRAITQVKIAGKTVPKGIVHAILGFVILYVGLFAVCSVLLSALGVDLLTSISAVASALGNVGPGFGIVGPTENYAAIPIAGKWLLSWCMLLGRLEIYTLIILLVPEFWRK